MRVMHLCLANPYIDGQTYQENCLPNAHKALGHNVYIVASTEVLAENKIDLSYCAPGASISEHGINILRIPYRRFFPKKIVRKLRTYRGLRTAIENFAPEIIFIHDVQFFDTIVVRKYVAERPNTIVYADCHADFSNSARNFLSRTLLHKIYYRWCAQQIDSVTTKFWATLPVRINFLKNMYSINHEKIDLLEMGFDDISYPFWKENEKSYSSENAKKTVRLLTGGKIDRFKLETINLMKSMLGRDKFELRVFGSVLKDVEDEFFNIVDSSTNIHYLGWLGPEEVFSQIVNADVGVFPGRHSVLWEQCVALGLPLAISSGLGMDHLDLNGNLVYLDLSDPNVWENFFKKIDNCSNLQCLQKSALKKDRFKFFYSEIGKKSLES